MLRRALFAPAFALSGSEPLSGPTGPLHVSSGTLDAGVPAIDPVAPDPARPLWSVMVPTYNCSRYLREALDSVLDQDPGPGAMQVEVVDDASVDRPEDVVETVGRGRVTFFRQPTNRGAIENFNTCIRRSRGQLVHILHGDDLVMPRFYVRTAELAERWRDVALLGVRSFLIEQDGVLVGITPRLPALETPSRDPGPLLARNPLTFGGVVMRRSFYEAFGGFNARLVHTADWEMWIRAVAEGGAVISPEVLAYYRRFEGNDTSRLRRTGENLRDCLRFAEVIAARVPTFDVRRFRARLGASAADQAISFRDLGDEAAARSNAALWRELVSPAMIARRAARAVLDALRDIRLRLGP